LWSCIHARTFRLLADVGSRKYLRPIFDLDARLDENVRMDPDAAAEAHPFANNGEFTDANLAADIIGLHDSHGTDHAASLS
jgi:hypothetical protein